MDNTKMTYPETLLILAQGNPQKASIIAALDVLGEVVCTLIDVPTVLALGGSKRAIRRALTELIEEGKVTFVRDEIDRRCSTYGLSSKTKEALKTLSIDANHQEPCEHELRGYSVGAERAKRAREYADRIQQEIENDPTIKRAVELRPELGEATRTLDVMLGLIKVYGREVFESYLSDLTDRNIRYPFEYLRECLRNHKQTMENKEKKKVMRRKFIFDAAVKNLPPVEPVKPVEPVEPVKPVEPVVEAVEQMCSALDNFCSTEVKNPIKTALRNAVVKSKNILEELWLIACATALNLVNPNTKEAIETKIDNRYAYERRNLQPIAYSAFKRQQMGIEATRALGIPDLVLACL